jgi:Transposase DDE domain
MVTGGQVHDSQVVEQVLDTPRPPLVVTADKAYDSEKVRQQIRDEGAVPIIPSRSNATRKAYCPKRIYRRRHNESRPHMALGNIPPREYALQAGVSSSPTGLLEVES